jgi:hypothetical protein
MVLVRRARASTSVGVSPKPILLQEKEQSHWAHLLSYDVILGIVCQLEVGADVASSVCRDGDIWHPELHNLRAIIKSCISGFPWGRIERPENSSTPQQFRA